MAEKKESNNMVKNKILNMNYFFNKQYFEGMNEEMEISKDRTSKSNALITQYRYKKDWKVNKPCNIEGVSKFQLFTAYPGLMMGIGYMHDVKSEEAIKCGFSLNYVTGYPYLPGSSLKGILRSYFPAGKKKDNEVGSKESNKEQYIKELLENVDVDVYALRDNIFENGDVFLDVFPGQGGVLLGEDYITPHNKGKYMNPVPIKLLKVKPNKKFDFCFLLNDYCNKEVIVSKEEKLNLFKQIILDMGVGAKTNVGFGKFIEEALKEEALKEEAQKQSDTKGKANTGVKKTSQLIVIQDINNAPQCSTLGCGGKIQWDKAKNKWHDKCSKCYKKGGNAKK